MQTTQPIQVAFCSRCGVPCKVAASATENAQLLKHSTVPSGYCPDCGVTDFFKNHSPLAMIMEQNPQGGKKMLLDPRVQAHFAGLLQAGNADARPEEINWQRVHDNWELPFKRSQKSRKRG